MGGYGRTRWAVWTWALLMVGCGPSDGPAVEPPSVEEEPPALETPPPQEQPLPDVIVVAPVKPDDEQASEPRPAPPMFQPGFHQALRWSYSTSQATSGTLTVRLRVPVGRPGQRVRLTFRSGDGALTLSKATVAKAGANGALASSPVAVTFAGSAGFSVGARALVVSDPVPFSVGFRDELAISFEVKGALGASAIETLPGSYIRSGAYASTSGALGGTASGLGLGLATVDVEGPPSRAFVAIGDSITEGYISERDDTRKAWPALTEARLGVPVVNSGVSGQGFYEELENLDQEVLSLQGITDCIVLLGTNDLSSLDMGGLQKRMETLVTRLQPRCRTWVSTLLPKEKSNHGDYEVVKRDRLAFNTWLRATYSTSLIDLEAATRQPDNVHLFLDGLEVDGIHPSAKGHQVMAAEVARVLREAGVQAAAGVQVQEPTEDAPPDAPSSSPSEP
ncbi:GDSL family lipase [Cystobacter ferrugineus]|uniref:GDSL family lipase n=1 Tax=Cystobacter ferrugineus TaxID=83449 RepID=A0A1L9B0X0_9BACT|nr:SGNH/GDSL hydrolase family protein [Cystobacter ferrugineus]OJH35909.1 GDSL family lipase [Cystobacter ferrugineus]